MFHAQLSNRGGGSDDALCQQEAIFHNVGQLKDRKLLGFFFVLLDWMDLGFKEKKGCMTLKIFFSTT